VQDLRDDIARKNIELRGKQREYQDLLDNPPKKNIFRDVPSPVKDQAAPSTDHILKFENELADIKALLQEQKMSSQMQQQSAYKADSLLGSRIQEASEIIRENPGDDLTESSVLIEQL